MESVVEEPHNRLVHVGRNGQNFQEAVGELDQPVAVVRQNEILVLAPSTRGGSISSSTSFHS